MHVSVPGSASRPAPRIPAGSAPRGLPAASPPVPPSPARPVPQPCPARPVPQPCPARTAAWHGQSQAPGAGRARPGLLRGFAARGAGEGGCGFVWLGFVCRRRRGRGRRGCRKGGVSPSPAASSAGTWEMCPAASPALPRSKACCWVRRRKGGWAESPCVHHRAGEEEEGRAGLQDSRKLVVPWP